MKLEGGCTNPLKMQLVSKARAVLWQLLLFIYTTLIEVWGKIPWENHDVDPLEFWSKAMPSALENCTLFTKQFLECYRGLEMSV